jgi:DNA-binding FrmR family transcriptional regulator
MCATHSDRICAASGIASKAKTVKIDRHSRWYAMVCHRVPDSTPCLNAAMIIHDAARKKSIVLRLKRAEGQLRGIQKLIESDADCEKVAQQLAAARKALDKTFFSLVGCVIAQGDVPADDVADLLARFS